MPGELSGDFVLVDDEREASQIHNKGWFGTPRSGGALELSLVEALYLAENGRLCVISDGEPLDLEAMLAHSIALDPGFEIKHLVYSDLKTRGLTVKPFHPSPPDFAVFERGAVPSRALSKFHVLARSEGAVFDIDWLRDFTVKSGSVSKSVILALVDEEGDLTYYDVELVSPEGKLDSKAPDVTGKAVLLEDGVLVFDAQLSEALRLHHFGKTAGKGLRLSLIEAAYLEERGVLVLSAGKGKKPVGRAALLRKARQLQRDFDLRLKVYSDLRNRGLVVRTGFKYGTHFRLYDSEPEKSHARYLLHAVPAKFVGTWPEMSRAVRLAHGVRKELLLARVGPRDDIVYLKLGRKRP